MNHCLLKNSVTLICLWILLFPIGIIEVSNSLKCCISLYFSSLHDYWPPSSWNSLVHTSWGKMEQCEKRAFQLLKMRKMKVRLNIRTKCETDFLLTGNRLWRILLVITRWSHKRQTFALISLKLMWILKFFVYRLSGI